MKTYRLEYPMAMSINLVPIEEGKDFHDEKGTKTYRGIIHSISENDKKALRQVVNDILFSPLNEKRAKEQEEFKEMHDKILEERRKAQEALQQSEGGQEIDPHSLGDEADQSLDEEESKQDSED